MLTEQEKAKLEALLAKGSSLSDTEKAELEALQAKAGEGDKGGEGETFSKAYVEQLRKENAKYRTRASEADTKLAQYDGIDPEEYKKLKDAQKKAQDAELAKQGEWDKLRTQLITEHGKEVEKKDKEIKALKDQHAQLEAELESTIMGHEIAVQASVAKAINPTLVEMVVKTMAKPVKLESGQRVIRVLDADGTERIDAKTGKPLTVAQLIEELKLTDQYAHLFEGATSGPGSKTISFGGSNIKNPWKSDSFNLTLQGEITKQNPEMAKRLKAEAGV
jgi:hypothetical protein